MTSDPEIRIYIAKRTSTCEYCDCPVEPGDEASRTLKGVAHARCKKRRFELLGTSEIAERLRISNSQFLKMAREMGQSHEGEYISKYKTTGLLWAPELVEMWADSEYIISIKSRSTARIEKRQRQLDKYADLFPDKKEAVLAATQAMYNLNRYAQHHTCSQQHQSEICGLNQRMVKYLYTKGYCSGAQKFFIDTMGFICCGCYGGGCGRCGGSGFYRKPGKLYFYAFRFKINGVEFHWHQLRFLVDWEVKCKSQEQQWQPKEEEPIEIKNSEYFFAKDLIRFVLGELN